MLCYRENGAHKRDCNRAVFRRRTKDILGGRGKTPKLGSTTAHIHDNTKVRLLVSGSYDWAAVRDIPVMRNFGTTGTNPCFAFHWNNEDSRPTQTERRHCC